MQQLFDDVNHYGKILIKEDIETTKSYITIKIYDYQGKKYISKQINGILNYCKEI